MCHQTSGSESGYASTAATPAPTSSTVTQDRPTRRRVDVRGSAASAVSVAVMGAGTPGGTAAVAAAPPGSRVRVTRLLVAVGRADVRAAADLVAGVAEHPLDDAAESEHDEHDERRDGRDEQTVLDGRSAVLTTTCGYCPDELKHVESSAYLSQLVVPTLALLPTLLHVSLNTFLTMPPRANTTRT